MSHPETLKIADWLTTAAKERIAKHPQEYGDLHNSYTMVAQLWAIYLINANVARHNNPPAQIHIDACDVAELMSLLKKVDKIYGVEKDARNFIDDITFAALGGQLDLVDSSADPFLKDRATASADPVTSYARQNADQTKAYAEARSAKDLAR